MCGATLVGVSACGGGASTTAIPTQSSAPDTSSPTSTTSPTSSGARVPSAKASPTGVVAGQKVFSQAGCATCHTLSVAGATGDVGPNLDRLKPSAAAVRAQVTHGGGEMPSFASRLSESQIQAVAHFVAWASRHDGG